MKILKEEEWKTPGNECVITHYVALKEFDGLYIVENIMNAKGNWIAYGFNSTIEEYKTLEDAELNYNYYIKKSGGIKLPLYFL